MGKDKRAFWRVEAESGKTVIDIKAMIGFINDLGYWVYYQNDSPDTYMFVKITKNIIKPVDTREIKSDVLSFVESVGGSSIIYNMLSDRVKYWTNSFLNALPIIKPEFLKDSEKYSYIATESFVYKIGSNGAEKLNYEELGDVVVWKSQITKKDFNIVKIDYDFDFYRFIRLVGGKNYKSLMSYIGYLMHDYKDPANARATSIYDTNVSQFDGLPEGGSGKSLLIKALKHIREVAVIPADRVDFKRSFLFQELSESTQIAWVDELPKGFDMSKFFSRITDGLPIEKKSKNPIFIEPENSPKFVFTSNYKPVGSSGSHKRRRLDFGVTNYFNVDRTPRKVFGRNFFISWNKKDWDMFFSVYVECLVIYLRQGNIRYDDSNEDYLTLISETSFDFAEYWIKDGWLKNLQEEKSINGRMHYMQFTEHYEINTLKYSLKKFYSDCKRMFVTLNLNVIFVGKGEGKMIEYKENG